ncbi:hypothetical protein SLEP1_g52800 [Rubroshorea leprosula]|uniref:DUF4283 domain-containing protein n=1 Tax=Rubroshorea leprosula TaxID=152421 RepID=A0AAV5M959_9ROSI|nr:hypothetical protein SLEP1_g52800 [Rubroshorea leprosula]
MGGKLVLLDCEDKEELKDLVEMASEWLGQWFEEIQLWSPNKIAHERFVWIRCQGAPLNVWGSDFFEKMGCSWGKFICLDDNTSKKKRFDIARMLISTPIMDTISVRRQIQINGSIYNLRFSEEEFTNSFFSLKQDFIPTFLSDSEENESWSIESSKNDHGFQDVDGEWQSGDEPKGAEGGEEDVVRRTGETNDGENRAWVTGTAKMGGNAAADAGSKNEEGRLLGLVEHNNSKSYGGVLKKRVGSFCGPNSEDSVPIALAQETMEGVSSISMGRKVISGNKIECSGQRNGEKRGSSGSCSGSDEGSVGDGGQRRAAGTQKRRKMRLRSCKFVYLQEASVQRKQCRNKRQGRRSKQPTGGQILPDFIASPNGEIVGESVGDSGIQNCNRSIKRKMQRKLAKEIWELAKHLGATVECDEEVICRIDEMEKRDSQAKADMEKKEAGGAKKLCRRVWGTEDFDWIAKPSKGLSGGLLGDFNAVRSSGERAGCNGISREMKDFDSFIIESGLVDLPMVGRKYTWYNANGQHMSWIDRFLVSEEWLVRWCDVT